MSIEESLLIQHQQQERADGKRDPQASAAMIERLKELFPVRKPRFPWEVGFGEDVSPIEEAPKQWQVGDIARTPFEPSGLVIIRALEPANSIYDECAFVEFAEDHPAGYRKGDSGRYQLKELRLAEAQQ